MSYSVHLNNLTVAAVEKLSNLEQQPPAINTRYAIRCDEDASVSASNDQVQTKIWFKSPPLTAHTLRMIRGVILFAMSHDQGHVGDMEQGNWTWFQLAILANENETSPVKDADGDELVIVSHPNKVGSRDYDWMSGETFGMDRKFMQSLQPGNVIAVQLCARFSGWQIFARKGRLIFDIGEDNAPVPVTPLSINTQEPVPCRRNVQAWYREAQTVQKTALELSLFIRALKTFQNLPPEDQMSYYRIAGIHGFPWNVPWNTGKRLVPLDDVKVHSDNFRDEGEGGYYCTHNMYIFPTWHRAYMMLYERTLSILMFEEAETRKDDSEEWVKAAKRWRLPYWDWAADPTLPEVAIDKKIRVVKSCKGGTQMEEIDNSMYRFQMPGMKPMGDESYGNYRLDNYYEDEQWQDCIGTSRHSIKLTDPDRRWVEGLSNADEVNASLQGCHENLAHLTLKDSVFRLLTESYTNKYVHFASTKFRGIPKDDAPSGDAKDYLNLEQIHNSVHEFTGGTGDCQGHGHMADPAVAAFDPVFWLHHCNIDRLFHLWQCSNPGNWFDQTRSDVFNDAVDDKAKDTSKDNPLTPLVPFHATARPGDYYNSNRLRHVNALNYTYDYMDEVTDSFGDVDPAKNHMYINKLYGPSDGSFDSCAKTFDPVINIIYDRYALGGKPYSLLFFLGAIDEGVPYRRQKSLVGSIVTFSSQVRGDVITCNNCHQQERDHVLSRAQFPLTRAVPVESRRNTTASTRFFDENLRWVAIHTDGTPVDKSKLGDLKLNLFMGVNQLREDLGTRSFFQFDDYRDQLFDFDKACLH